MTWYAQCTFNKIEYYFEVKYSADHFSGFLCAGCFVLFFFNIVYLFNRINTLNLSKLSVVTDYNFRNIQRVSVVRALHNTLVKCLHCIAFVEAVKVHYTTQEHLYIKKRLVSSYTRKFEMLFSIVNN